MIPTNNSRNINSLTVFHMNIGSLRNKVSMLESLFIDRDRQPSVVCITEHWLASGEEQYCNINYYQIAAVFNC